MIDAQEDEVLVLPLTPSLRPSPHVELSEKMGGSPCVVGTRVPVRRLWQWHRKGVSVETLVNRYPSLGWARVLGALAFAYDNEDLIEADLTRERTLLTEPSPAPSSSHEQAHDAKETP